MRKIYLALVSVFFYNIIFAQGPRVPAHVERKAEIKLVQDQLDSLVVSYFVQKSIEGQKKEAPQMDSLFIPEFSDSVLSERLKDINSLIPLDYNDKTRAFINMYTRQKRDIVPYILSLSEYYFPIFEAELDRTGLPLELRYLPVIESALKPRAVSKAGAVGLWQFMYPTARMCGLTITSYVDERKDPIRSTQAACKYLGDLYKMFGDWQLAIAAYNCGPGNVNKAIRRSGGKTNFWEIYNYLPRETRGYVPAFIAAAYFFNYYTEHNIGIAKIELPLAVDTVLIDKYMHLSDISKEMGISLVLLRELNPHYKVDIIPASKTNPFLLVLPMEKCLRFCEHSDTLYKQYELRSHGRSSEPAANATTSTSTSTATASSIAGKTALYYTVKSGDNLSYIADWYDIYLSTLKSWNNLSSTNIRAGQKLLVYVPSDKVSYYSPINNMSFEEKKNIANYAGSSAATTTSNTGTVSYIYHTFKSGDTLWDLCNKYPGNTVAEIMSMNSISDVRYIKAGQVIKLKKA